MGAAVAPCPITGCYVARGKNITKAPAQSQILMTCRLEKTKSSAASLLELLDDIAAEASAQPR